MSIYVEIRIRGSIDDLWRRTQEPDLHERWDLRFSEIVYLPRPHETAPQRFSYATRIGFGLRIRGEGESEGSRANASGERVSALKFWSGDAKSLILEGSGYWRYVPTSDGVRFLTWYSYRTRFGLPGRLLDAALFRPIMGWATAWSFDRLRLWIEKGIDPAVSGQRAVIHAVARLCIALVFLYHGLVPKLLFRHPTELAILLDAGLPRLGGQHDAHRHRRRRGCVRRCHSRGLAYPLAVRGDHCLDGRGPRGCDLQLAGHPFRCVQSSDAQPLDGGLGGDRLGGEPGSALGSAVPAGAPRERGVTSIYQRALGC